MLGQDWRSIMKLLTSHAGDEVVLVQVRGELDAHTVRGFEQTLNDLLAQGHSRLVLDASQMSFISSAGLRAVMSAQREAGQLGGQLRICGLNAQARRVFEIAGVEQFLNLSETRQEAMAGW
jgi:anti-anti-sigma factor